VQPTPLDPPLGVKTLELPPQDKEHGGDRVALSKRVAAAAEETLMELLAQGLAHLVVEARKQGDLGR
jgi:hypothetical protein